MRGPLGMRPLGMSAGAMLLIGCTLLLAGMAAAGPSRRSPAPHDSLQLSGSSADGDDTFGVSNSLGVDIVVGAPPFLTRVLEQVITVYNLVADPGTSLRLNDGVASGAEGDSDGEGLDPDFLKTASPTDVLVAQFMRSNVDVVFYQSCEFLFNTSRDGLLQLPLFSVASVPVFRIPHIPRDASIVLTVKLLSRIFRGNITAWNDPEIIALNLALAAELERLALLPGGGGGGGAPLPPGANGTGITSGITVVMGSRAKTPAWSVLHRAFCKVEPLEYERDVGGCFNDTTYAPDPSRYSELVLVDDLDEASQQVLSHASVLGFNSQQDVVFSDLSAVSVMNWDGTRAIPATSDAAYVALLERGQDFVDSNGNPTGEEINEYYADLTLPRGPDAWPFSQYVYAGLLAVPSLEADCAARLKLYHFMLWIFTADMMQSLAAAQYISNLPGVVTDKFDLRNALVSIACNATDPSYVDTTSRFVGAAQLTTLMSFMTSFVSAQLAQLGEMAWTEMQRDEAEDAFRAGNAVAAAKVSIAPDDANGFNSPMSDRHLAIPFVTATVLPSFHLHKHATAAVASLPAAQQSSFYPLVLDLDTLALIFTGAISSWTDARLTRYNPLLRAVYSNGTAADANITVVVCCSDEERAQSSLDLLYSALEPSAYFQASPLARSFPLNFSQIFTADSETSDQLVQRTPSGIRFRFSETEAHLQSLVQATEGAIGFQPMRSQIANADDSVFAMVRWPGASLTDAELRTAATPGTVVRASISSQAACVSAAVDSIDLTDAKAVAAAIPQLYVEHAYLDMSHPSIPDSCWPLTRTLSWVVLPEYFGYPCGSANFSLQVVQGVSADSSNNLDVLYASGGMFRLAYEPSGVLNAKLNAQFNSITCDGETLLINTPRPWILSDGLTKAVTALVSTCEIIAIVLIGVVLYFRNLPLFRSSSVPFLVMILVGLTISFQAITYWASPATDYNCAVFNWLGNLGFTLSFGPLFAKVWRVWRIFGRAVLKVVKITNAQLGRMVAVLVVFDIVVLAVWQSSDAKWGARTILREENSRVFAYTHCSPTSGDTVYLALLGISKAVLLLFGAVMGLATRNVNATFNESKAIAYAIYSTCFTLVVILPVVLLLGQLGDGLVAIIAFGLWWIVFSVLGAIFFPKLSALKEKWHEHRVHSASRTGESGHKSESLGFSFPSLSLIPSEQIRRYVGELRTQLRAAELKMRSLGLSLPATGDHHHASPQLGARRTPHADDISKTRNSHGPSHNGVTRVHLANNSHGHGHGGETGAAHGEPGAAYRVPRPAGSGSPSPALGSPPSPIRGSFLTLAHASAIHHASPSAIELANMHPHPPHHHAGDGHSRSPSLNPSSRNIAHPVRVHLEAHQGAQRHSGGHPPPHPSARSGSTDRQSRQNTHGALLHPDHALLTGVHSHESHLLPVAALHHDDAAHVGSSGTAAATAVAAADSSPLTPSPDMIARTSQLHSSMSFVQTVAGAHSAMETAEGDAAAAQQHNQAAAAADGHHAATAAAVDGANVDKPEDVPNTIA